MSPEKRAKRIGLTELLRTIRASQREIQDRIRRAVEEGTEDQLYYSKQLNQISSVYNTIRAIWAAYAQDEIPAQYDRYVRSVKEQFERLGKAQIVAPRLDIVEQMVLDTVARMQQATENGLANVQTLFRDTQQAVVADAEITRRLAEGTLTDMTPTNLRNVVRSELYKSLSGGNILQINGRRYKADYYAELVARTRTREAQSQAIIDTVKSFGEDLVRVSSHNTESEICIPYEGNIYSLTGQGPYPILTEYPPFHPNCQHVLTPYI